MPLQAWGTCDSIEAFSLTVGTSSILGLTAMPGQVGLIIRMFANTATLQVGGASLTWGLGGILSGNTTAFQLVKATGTVYFAATGATVTIGILRGRSAGNGD